MNYFTPAICILLLSATQMSVAQESPQEVNPTQYKVITIVESIVPGGIGRSRMIETKSDFDLEKQTTERTDGKKSDQSGVKRKDAKVDEFAETKLLNFYSMTGINFQNVASNDAAITAKMNEMAQAGWILAFMASGVESEGGDGDGNGIYITRLVFKK